MFKEGFRGLFTPKGLLKYGSIAIGALAVICIIYYNTQMRPADFLSHYDSHQPPVSGQVVQYDFEKNKTTLEITGADMAADLWSAMENSQVRFIRSFSAANVPIDGYYYEVTLSDEAGTAQGTTTYAFGCNTAGELIIGGTAYGFAGESGIIPALDALFTQYEGEVTPAS